MSELTGVERHLHAAQRMLLRGVRPTVDLLVNECGGSRTTAQKALAELWENRLPGLLSAREYEDNVPVAVREAVGALWREAREQAETAAQDAFRAANASLDAERAEMQAILAGIHAEREQARAQAETLHATIEQLAGERDARIAELGEQARRLALIEKDRDAWFVAHERVAADAASVAEKLDEARLLAHATAAEHAAALREAAEQLTRQRAEAEADREAQRAAHQEAIDALKAAYVDSEARLRVDLDAARTELAQSRKAAERAAQAHREREDELLREVAALKAVPRAGAVRMIGRKSPLSPRKKVAQ